VAKAKEVPAVSAHAIKELLEARYQPPEWFCQREVQLNSRRIDVLAVNCWGGYGRLWQVHAVEVKVTRADWLRELDNFHKARQWAAVADAFLVATPAGLVRREELPEGWGLLETNGRTLRIKVHPAPATPGDTLPRELVGRLLTRAREDAERAIGSHNADLRRTLRAELAEEMAEKAAKVDERLAEKAANWDRLLAEAGMSYGDPVATLVKAQALVAAFKKLPGKWPHQRLVQDLQDFHSRMGAVLTDGGPALEAFRTLLEQADG
jgi:hypothetical protein